MNHGRRLWVWERGTGQVPRASSCPARDGHEPGATVGKPEPVYVPFRGRETRVRHDDPTLRPYMPMATVLRSAASLASDIDGLRLVLASTVGDRYRIEVPDDGREVRLRRRA